MKIYNIAKGQFLSGGINLASDDIRIALFTSSYTPNIDTDEFLSDINANEYSGSGYTAGGLALGTKAVNVDTTNDRATFTAADAVWEGVTFSGIRTAVLLRWGGNAGNSRVIAWRTAGADAGSTNDDFTISFPDGIVLTLNDPA
jgi:hypothetical protein